MDQDHYIELKKQVGETLRSQADQFDKAILTLAAGALALSLTFLKEIVPTPNRLIIELLVASWGCFIASVCLTLFSCQTSVFAHQRLDQILNIQQSKPDTDVRSLRNHWVWVTTCLNLLSLVVFVSGTVLLSCSAYHGLKMKECNVADQKRLTEGAIPLSPPVASNPAPSPQASQPQPGTGAVPPSGRVEGGAIPLSPPVAQEGQRGAVPPTPPVATPKPATPPPLPSGKK